MGEIDCRLKLDYEDKEEAKKIKSSIEPDDKNFVRLELRGSTLICKSNSEPLQLLHTVDDLLMCISVAEKTIKDK